MDRNRNHLGQRQGRSQTHARRLTDEQLEALAVAFGSHLVRNAPPHPNPGALLSNRNVKITAE